jgi:acetyl-CoA carboxylase biotin carboxylase subunit
MPESAVFRKVLVANRGEIAVRIIRTLQQMGIAAVAVYSDVDRKAPHVELAGEAYPLDGLSALDTYLNQEKLLAVARESGAEAVHPGYGFLAENAAFAAALEAAGIRWIGPPAGIIEAMGDKTAARRLMQAAGVPVVPGSQGEVRSLAEARRAAKEIGYPVLVKAAAGGGGKGMRRVETPAQLSAAMESAQREAQQAFGDGRVLLEKYIPQSRHVEIQILGDAHGNVAHLFERECSIQRRHQKIIEESPSPALDPDLRARIGEAAVSAARTIAYQNAGTVEFILDEANHFYFLEVNTRLQVEHPVTELVTGWDLVREQVRAAAGEPLAFRQEDLRQAGHAIECRIYAEDPDRDFLPTTGTIQVYREPAGPWIRVDSGVEEGTEVSIHYDPILAKVVTWGEDRQAALSRMEWALAHFVTLGVVTNIPFLRRVVSHPAFRAGEIHTHFLEEHPVADGSAKVPLEALAAAALFLRQAPRAQAVREAGEWRVPSPWREGGGWRMGGRGQAVEIGD